MTPHEIYTLVLCLIVLVLFTLTFSYLIVSNYRMHLSLLRLGQLDRQLKKEYSRKRSRLLDILNRLFSWLLVLAMLGLFGFSMYVNLQPNTNTTQLRVVKSGSMQAVHENNAYLLENGITDRLDIFDLILIRPLPAEEDLAVYDIVVYEKDDTEIIHRIVEIDPPTPFHNETYYLLQGDANAWPDEYPVYYDQMTGIYRGERIPFVGSFVLFMQSPAGWLCTALILATFVATSFAEKKLRAEEQKRLALLTGDSTEPQSETESQSVEV